MINLKKDIKTTKRKRKKKKRGENKHSKKL